MNSKENKNCEQTNPEQEKLGSKHQVLAKQITWTTKSVWKIRAKEKY